MTQSKLSQSRTLVHAFIAAAILLATTVLTQAQISINLGVNPTIDFTTAPAVTEWATLTAGIGAAGAGTYGTPATVDAGAQTVSQSTINLALPSFTGANGANANARHNQDNGYLITQPTTVAATVLKATLRNNSGNYLSSITINYDFGVAVASTTETAFGHRAFFSLTGLPNSWTPIAAASGLNAATAISTALPVGFWPDGTDLYIIWLDDNGATNPDGGYTIDNFSVNGAVVTNITAINITSSPTNTTVAERGAVTFTVAATGAPQEYHWLSNGVAIAGANSASYSIASTPFSANGAVFSCVVSNALGAQTSAGATLTVAADATPPTAVRADASTNGVIVVVTFSEPISPGLDASSFKVFPTGTDPDATGIDPISAVVNGSTVTLDLGVTPLTDGVNFSVRMYDVYDTSEGVPGGNLIAPYPTIIPVRRDLLLIDFDGPNNVWKFATNVFGTGWETVGYDDTTWDSGQVGIGLDTSGTLAVPIRTPAYESGSGFPYFFRRHFFLPASATDVTLTIRHLFEDGAVIFLNGQEAGRVRVNPGTLTATTLSTGATESAPVGTSSLSVTGLVAGDNVIAVVVLQSAATSTDMEFALELVANIGTYAAGPPSIVTQPVGQSVTEGGNVSLSVVADGALPLTYQWSRNNTPITGATNASYNIAGVLPSQAGNYRVLVSNNLGSSNSAIAALTVTADTTAPVFVSAVGAANLTNITLTITDAFGLNQTAVETEANYSVALTAGGGNLTIESAVLVNGTNVVLTTSPRTQGQNYTVTLSGIVDRSEAANAVTPSTRPVVATVILLAYNQVWRYDESGNDLGTAWKDVGYNDGSWLTGAGFLAFEPSVGPATLFTNLAGGNGANTILNLTNQTLGGIGGTNITFYFRTTVGSLPFDPSAPGNVIRATSYFDDGGVIYVNGSEQVRFNLTNSPVALNYTNLAVVGSTEGTGGLVTSNLLGFVQGNNVIAAEVHQNAMTSSDIAWGLQLEALVTTFGSSGPTLHISYSGGNVTVTWSGGGTLQHSTNLSSPANWGNVPGSPSSPYTTSATGPFRFYRVTVP